MSGELRLISWPFHNGLEGVGMGRGPLVLAADPEVRASIEGAGWSLQDDEVAPVDESHAEIARVAELMRRLAKRVRLAVQDGAFPLIVAGNCNSCVGTVAGVGADQLGVVWFDAHADFDDPEENTSGFFDVMGLAMLTGRGWQALRHTIPGHQPIPERDVILAGVRDLEPYQRRRLEQSEVSAVSGSIDRPRFGQALGELRARATRVYLHVDLDALDSSEGRANAYSSTGGPGLNRLLECVRSTCERFTVAASAVTAYDPALDDTGAILDAARQIAYEIAIGVRKHRRDA